jgi:hypothetical protein
MNILLMVADTFHSGRRTASQAMLPKENFTQAMIEVAAVTGEVSRLAPCSALPTCGCGPVSMGPDYAVRCLLPTPSAPAANVRRPVSDRSASRPTSGRLRVGAGWGPTR